MNTCRHCGPTAYRIRARGLCNHCYLHKPGVRERYAPARGAKKPWTAREMRDLAALVAARVPRPEIARRLGRTVCSVNMACHREGVRRWARRPGYVRERVSRLARPGRTDDQLAALIGCSRSTVAQHRKALGIPRGVSRAEAARYSMRVALSRHGGIGHLHAEAGRVEAARAGWPVGCTAAKARVLSALEAGPLTAARVAEALGMANPSSAYSQLTPLKRLGWVTGGTPGVRGSTWSLAPNVAGSRRAAQLRKGA